MAQRTAPRPHRHTVILAVATIAAMIGTAVLVKASAQTTTNNGNGVAVGTNTGTINNNTASNASNCRTAALRFLGSDNVTVKKSTSVGYDCGVDMQNSNNGKVEDFLAIH
jgi:hypothetical protein